MVPHCCRSTGSCGTQLLRSLLGTAESRLQIGQLGRACADIGDSLIDSGGQFNGCRAARSGRDPPRADDHSGGGDRAESFIGRDGPAPLLHIRNGNDVDEQRRDCRNNRVGDVDMIEKPVGGRHSGTADATIQPPRLCSAVCAIPGQQQGTPLSGVDERVNQCVERIGILPG